MSSPTPASRTAWIGGALRPRRLAALSLGALGLGVLVWVSHPSQLRGSLEDLEPAYVAAVLLLNVPVVLLRAWRGNVVLAHLGHRVPYLRMVCVQLVGQTSSAISPAASGDLVRAYFWKRDDAVPLRKGAAAITFERVYSLVLMAAVAALLILLPRHGFGGWAVAGLGLAAVAFVPLAVGRLPSELDRALLVRVSRLPVVGGLADQLLGALEYVRGLISSPSLLAKTSALTLAGFIPCGLQIWLLLVDLGHRVPITQAVAVYSSSQVAGTLSALPFGLGPADALVVGAFAAYGLPLATGAALAVLLRALTTVPQALAALLYFVWMEGQYASRTAGRTAA